MGSFPYTVICVLGINSGCQACMGMPLLTEYHLILLAPILHLWQYFYLAHVYYYFFLSPSFSVDLRMFTCSTSTSIFYVYSMYILFITLTCCGCTCNPVLSPLFKHTSLPSPTTKTLISLLKIYYFVHFLHGYCICIISPHSNSSYVPTMGTAGLYSRFIFSFLRILYAGFHNDDTCL